MNLHADYRLSTGVCLVCATLCIGYADPIAPFVFYVVLAACVALAMFFETRWQMPSSVSNVLGVVILMGWVGWLYLGIKELDSAADSSDMLRIVLPRMAPLLGLLVLAKLVRPKSLSDHWLIHTLGLVQVILACVLALLTRLDRRLPTFALLFLGYVTTAVWSMLIFAMHREACRVMPRDKASGYQRTPTQPEPWRWGGVLRAAGWSAISLVLGLTLFFGVPRPGTDPGSALSGSSSRTTGKIGYGEKIDVRDTGRLDAEGEPEAVLFVRATDSHGQEVRLPPNQKFRGGVCASYQRGEWKQVSLGDTEPLAEARPPRPGELQPHEVDLWIEVDLSQLSPKSVPLVGQLQLPRTGDHTQAEYDLFLAEPVYRQNQVRVYTLPDESAYLLPFLARTDRSVVVETPAKPNRYRYRQIMTAMPGIGRRANVEIVGVPSESVGTPTGNRRYTAYIAGLQRLFVAHDNSLKDYPDAFAYRDWEVLTQYTQSVLRKTDLHKKPDDVDHVQWMELKAKALESHLLGSGEFFYSLERTRVETQLDPTVDFLKNTKKGHCELFASALVLMLRAEQIPARLVRGFQGAEWNERLACNVVYHHHAHVWVEALIGQADYEVGAEYGGKLVRKGFWLTLDGTPEIEAPPTGALAEEALAAKYYWETMFLDYNRTTQRREVMGRIGGTIDRIWPDQDFWSKLFSPGEWSLSGIAAVVAIVSALAAVGAMYFQRRRGAVAKRTHLRSTVEFYNELLAILSRARLRPKAYQTAQEFVSGATEQLASRAGTTVDAGILQRLVGNFYGVRYGEQPLTPEESVAVDRALRQLATTIV